MADRADWLPDLEAELRALGREIDVPLPLERTADLRARLAQPSPRRHPRLRWRVVVPVVLALLAVLAVTPPGQAVITHVFRFAGIELREEPGPLPTPTPTPTGTGALPGEQRMPLERARRRVTFPILVPAALGAPDEVAVSDRGRVASLVYRRTPWTPYGEVRLDEFEGDIDPIFFKKFVSSADVTETSVAGRPALWMKGPHAVTYVRRDGTPDHASARLTHGNTLIWGTGPVALRLEGDLDMAQAVAIAGSAREGT